MNQFEIPQNLNPMENIIKVIGVGGGGSNAVKYLYNLNVKNVDFIVCNTDHQHLISSPIPNKIQLGKNLTKGLGAGCIPEKGREAAIESKEEIKRLLENNTEMLFIAAGLGGGTGTGAAPIIAEVARSLNILTVAIVTLPFKFEGKKKMDYAEKGLGELKKHVDSIIVIPNEKLKEIYPGMKMTEAFAKADDVVSTAAKSIAEIITNNLHINVDFNDVRTVMQNSGTALMGTAIARGENRALEALKNAINHPLLMNNSIEGARHILLSITTGSEDITTDEFEAITTYITEASGGSAEVIPGYGTDTSIGDAVSITIVATGFQLQNVQSKSNASAAPFTNVTKVEDVCLSENLNKNNPVENIVTNNFKAETKTETDEINSSQQFKIEEATSLTIDKTTADLQNDLEKSDVESQESQITNELDINVQSVQDIPNNESTPTFELSENTEIPPVTKIIEKQRTESTASTNAIEQLSENIKILSDKSNAIRKRILDLNNPSIQQELENIPAIIRKKERFSSENGNNQNINPKDHSHYTIDNNGNIKPNNPYIDNNQD